MIFIVMTILLPLLVALGILISPWWSIKERVGRFKFGTFVGSSIVVSGIICGLLYCGGTSKMYFKEVWNYKITSIEHQERWTTKEMRTRQVYCGSDSKGNAKYRTEIYYVTETHGPYWYAYDEYGNGHGISEGNYNNWKMVWSNERKTGVHNGSAAGWFEKAITGGIFQCDWTGKLETIYPWAEINSYVNKVRVSRSSVFNLAEPTKEQLKNYPRPADEGITTPVISYGPTINANDILFIQRINASLGVSKQIHVLIVVFDAKNGREVINDILTAWRGPNKNELVIFTGLDNGNVKMCEVHSWMDNTTLHSTLRDRISDRKFDLREIGGFLLEDVPKHWNRKHFKDFDYLTIDIHWGWSFAGFIAIIIVMSVSFYVVEFVIDWD